MMSLAPWPLDHNKIQVLYTFNMTNTFFVDEVWNCCRPICILWTEFLKKNINFQNSEYILCDMISLLKVHLFIRT